MKLNYFAYGSNMDKEDLDKWCDRKGYPKINFLNVSSVKLPGYKLVFNYFSSCRESGAANVMASDGDCVYGLLIELEEKQLAIIGIKEGYKKERSSNSYEEIVVEVEKFDGTVVQNVKTYKVSKSHEKSAHQPPARYYLDLIKNNAKTHGFPEEYIKYLETIETCPV